GDWMANNFPNVKVLIGHTKNGAPVVGGREASRELMASMEMTCRGGCLATTRYAFDMLHYEGKKKDFKLNLFIGAGVQKNGQTYYFDRDGKAYSFDDISKLPGKKLAIGSCTRHLSGIANRHVDGCMPMPNSPHMAIHWMSGTFCSVMTPKNRHLLPELLDTMNMMLARIVQIGKGKRLDCALRYDDGIVETRVLSNEEKRRSYIPWPLPPLTGKEKRQLIATELRSILSTFLG
ncbi:MAG: hypothetical protein PHY31_09445, partial [Smithellaceae bacterium]|nr:hypothetical protein [Smithellaceae bacterium]